jgi:hypothetical protein
MENPYGGLKARIRRHLRDKQIDEKIVELVRAAYEEVLRDERFLLSRAERESLLQIVLRDTLIETLAGI